MLDPYPFRGFRTRVPRQPTRVVTYRYVGWPQRSGVEDRFFGTASDPYNFDVEALPPHVDRVGFDVRELREKAAEI